MNQNLKEIILLTAMYFNKSMTSDLLNLYLDDLSDLDVDECIDAYKIYRRNPKNLFMPLPSQIREIVRPNEKYQAKPWASEIASRIGAAISRFGYTNADKAKEYIGDKGWELVQERGGWLRLCESHGVDFDSLTFHAQIRDQLEARILFGKDFSSRPMLSESQRKQLPKSQKQIGGIKDLNDV